MPPVARRPGCALGTNDCGAVGLVEQDNMAGPWIVPLGTVILAGQLILPVRHGLPRASPRARLQACRLHEAQTASELA